MFWQLNTYDISIRSFMHMIMKESEVLYLRIVAEHLKTINWLMVSFIHALVQ